MKIQIVATAPKGTGPVQKLLRAFDFFWLRILWVRGAILNATLNHIILSPRNPKPSTSVNTLCNYHYDHCDHGQQKTRSVSLNIKPEDAWLKPRGERQSAKKQRRRVMSTHRYLCSRRDLYTLQPGPEKISANPRTLKQTTPVPKFDH